MSRVYWKLVAILLWASLWSAIGWGQSRVGGSLSPDGAEVQIDLPAKFHLQNRGGSDGKGLCVFASLKHASIWQYVPATENVFEYMFTQPGGGWPAKVDKVIAAVCKQKGIEVPAYIQYQGKDLSVLELALKTGRMPCVTYSYSPSGRYGGKRIAHMVNLVHMDSQWVGVLDNNFPGSIEWIETRIFIRVFTGGNNNGWAVIFLNPGPPPPPRSR